MQLCLLSMVGADKRLRLVVDALLELVQQELRATSSSPTFCRIAS
jgi:hypothetical protein